MTDADKIKNMVAANRLEEALDMLSEYSYDEAMLLKARFNSDLRKNQMGMIDSADLFRSLNQIANAILEISRYINITERQTQKLEQTFIQTRSIPKRQPVEAVPEILLAYHPADRMIARRIASFLRKNDVKGYIEDHRSPIPVQDLLQAFLLKKGAGSNRFFIPVISQNSLREGWTGFGQHLDYFSNALIYKNALPVGADTDWINLNIHSEIERLDDQIDALDAAVADHPDASPRHKATRAGLIMLRNTLPQIVQRLRNTSVLQADIGQFDTAMQKVLKTIRDGMQQYQQTSANRIHKFMDDLDDTKDGMPQFQQANN